MSKKKKLLTIFLSTLKISATTFGGGFVIIPLLRERFVKQLHWIKEEDILDLVAVAQSSPGAIAVNASIIVGYHVAGLAGALVAALGTIIPPFVIISIISYFYLAFRDNPYINVMMAGMLAAVAAVILDVVISMTKQIFKLKRVLPILILAGAFIASYFFSVHIFVIIFTCACIGLIDMFIQTYKKARKKSMHDKANMQEKSESDAKGSKR